MALQSFQSESHLGRVKNSFSHPLLCSPTAENLLGFDSLILHNFICQVTGGGGIRLSLKGRPAVFYHGKQFAFAAFSLVARLDKLLISTSLPSGPPANNREIL